MGLIIPRSRVRSSPGAYLFHLENNFFLHLMDQNVKYRRWAVLGDCFPNSLVGQDMWFSPTRPGFESRLGNLLVLQKKVFFFLGTLFQKIKNAPGEDRTRDLRIMRPTRCQLRHRSENRARRCAADKKSERARTAKGTPTVGLEPTTTRLRVLRSTN